LHDSLRLWLESHLVECIEEGSLQIEDPKRVANLIYTILEGAYYYLCMEKNTATKDEIMEQYKQHAYQILGLEMQ
jgi:hypothetical protein